MADVYVNEGELFSEESLEELDTYEEWDSEEIEEARQKLEELYEKREGQLEEGLNEMETRYFWISYALRALGFSYSVAELTPDFSEDIDFRPDFTLFSNPDELRNSIPHRGERDFFVQALGIMRAIGWGASIDEYEGDEEDEVYNVAYEVDRLVRSTGVQWGLATNGRRWRIYHRDSVGLLDTYFEIDLIESLHSADPDAFKYFWMVFSPTGLGGEGGVQPVVERLL